MCSRVTCTICGKPTWSGCGEHIEAALQGVPVAERCPGHPRVSAEDLKVTRPAEGPRSRQLAG